MSVGFWLASEAGAMFRALRRDARALEVVALRRLRDTLRAAANTPFYRPRLPLREPDPIAALRSLRPVTKAELLAAGDDALFGGRRVRSWRTSLSSGSTDEPFQAYFDARAWAMLKYLVKLRARAVCGAHPGLRTAVLEPVPPRGIRHSLPGRMARLRGFSALKPASEIAAALADFGPRVLCGWPSALLDVAVAAEATGTCIRPQLVFTSGELLLPGVRRGLASAYHCRVYDIYGTSETKEIAWECRSGAMHINSDVLLVEVLDQADCALPAGEEGAIVVTVLVNQAMPLLRYRTGDRGSLCSDSCPCGLALPLLGLVAGREAETLELAGRCLSPYALTCAIERVAGTLRYDIVQIDIDRLQVRAIAPGQGSDATRLGEVVRAALQAAVPPQIRVAVEWVDRLPAEPGTKRRLIVPLAETSHMR